MKCFNYFESPERLFSHYSEVIGANTEKVPLLAPRWSFDPAAVDERLIEQANGIAGDPSRLY